MLYERASGTSARWTPAGVIVALSADDRVVVLVDGDELLYRLLRHPMTPEELFAVVPDDAHSALTDVHRLLRELVGNGVLSAAADRDESWPVTP